MPTLEQAISEHEFRLLFVQELGWERGTGALSFPARGRTWPVEVIAHKRGLQVCWCRTDRYTLLNRYLIRDIHARLSKLVHENILILTCDNPRKQVWAWAVRRPDGDRFRHREHPFFSARPPALFLERLKRLEFTLAEEEHADLTGAVNRVRTALDTSADTSVDLFVKRPAYAVRSDALALAARAGDTSAFHRFVLLHLPLARNGSKRLRRWFGMPPEDAEQIAVLGLLTACKRFDPTRGIQFSTYGIWWIRQACQKYGAPAALFIRVPPHVLWPCLRHQFAVNIARIAGGPEEAHRCHTAFLEAGHRLGRRWTAYHRARAVESLTDRQVMRNARRIREPLPPSDTALIREEVVARMRVAVDRLHPRYADVIRRRFGMGCEEETLNEIGTAAGLTRERIRQIEAKGLSLLRKSLDGLVDEWWVNDEEPDEAEED